MFGLPGGSEWILLVLIVLLLFGSARLPRLARSMREAKDEFKKASEAKKDDVEPEGTPQEKA